MDDELRRLKVKCGANGGGVSQLKAVASEGGNRGIRREAWSASDKMTSDDPAGARNPDSFQSSKRCVKPA